MSTRRVAYACLAGSTLALAACAVTPVSQQELGHAAGHKAPIRAEIVLGLKGHYAERVDFDTVDLRAVSYGAAQRVLGQFFDEVDIRGRVHDPHLVIKVYQRFFPKKGGGGSTALVVRKIAFDVRWGSGERVGYFDVSDIFEFQKVRHPEHLSRVYDRAYLTLASMLMEQGGISADLTSAKLASRARGASAVSDWELRFTETRAAVVGIRSGERGKKSGHGFLVGRGVVLTPLHLVADGSDLVVVLENGQQYSADIAIRDRAMDLAILAIDEEETPWVALYSSYEDYAAGDEAVVVGPRAAEGESVTDVTLAATFGPDEATGFVLDKEMDPGLTGTPVLHGESDKVIGVLVADGPGPARIYDLKRVSTFLFRNAMRVGRERTVYGD